jgi:hypothetical protein
LRKSGIDLGKFTVWDDGVFFDTLRAAQIFAERHNKDLVQVDGQVSGWLAKNRD